MPYVPACDRGLIDEHVQIEAKYIVENSPTNFDLLRLYKVCFENIAIFIQQMHDAALQTEKHKPPYGTVLGFSLAKAIYETGKKYEYEGAFLGELNYAITRLIQVVPQEKVKLGHFKPTDELRYWLYAMTVDALVYAVKRCESCYGIGGVYEDVKDEYKRRVNTAYEAAQIIKNGDCYNTPYYTKLLEVVDTTNNHIGHIEVMVKRGVEIPATATLRIDKP